MGPCKNAPERGFIGRQHGFFPAQNSELSEMFPKLTLRRPKIRLKKNTNTTQNLFHSSICDVKQGE